MKIRTEFCWSAPDHSRYSAVTDDYDGPGSPIGSGATEIAAIRDLLDDIEDREEAELQAQRARERVEKLAHLGTPAARHMTEEALDEIEDAEFELEEMDRLAFERAHAWGTR